MKKIVIVFFASLLIISCKKNNLIQKENNELNSTLKNVETSEQKKNSKFQEIKTTNPLWYERNASYNIQDCSVSKEKLTSAIWRMDPIINQFALLVFDQNNEFKIGTLQAGVVIKGNYKIENNQIMLFDYVEDPRRGIGFSINNNEYICSINFNSNNFLYKNEIDIEGVKFFPVGSERMSGETAIINNEKVVIVRKKYVFNDSVKFRTKPILQSELIKVLRYSELEYNQPIPEIYSFVKGTIVEVLAKKEETETIDNVTASWCYIKVSDGFEGDQYGWVFGGYFDEYDKNKSEEYYSVMWHEIKVRLGIEKEIEQP